MPIPPESYQDPKVLAIRVQALEEALEKVTQAMNQNNAAYGQAFHLTDAHLWVLRRICEDVTKLVAPRGATGDLLEDYNGPLKLTKDCMVDLSAYYTAFNEHQKQQALLEAQRAEAAKARASAAEPEGETFGGDYDDGKSQERNESGEEAGGGEALGEDVGDGRSSTPSVSSVSEAVQP